MLHDVDNVLVQTLPAAVMTQTMSSSDVHNWEGRQSGGYTWQGQLGRRCVLDNPHLLRARSRCLESSPHSVG